MRLRVDPWAPEYDGALQLPLEAEEDESPAEIDIAVEQPLWQQILPREMPRPAIIFVDGVRRVELRVLGAKDEYLFYGLFGALAVGAARIGPQEARISDQTIVRVLVLGGGEVPKAVEVAGLGGSISLCFDGHAAAENTPVAPMETLQRLMRTTEAVLAQNLALSSGTFVIGDGPLTHLRPSTARILGFIKRLHRAYLPTAESRLLLTFEVGHRTPIFLIRDPAGRFDRYSWYVRLATPPPLAHAYAGVVRMEVSSAAGLELARLGADISARFLPGMASTPERDPRAPQNLVPIGALERDLRHRLGDSQWIRRLLMSHLSTVGGDV